MQSVVCFQHFNVLVLDEGILALSQRYRQDMLVLPEDGDWNRGNSNLHTDNLSCGTMANSVQATEVVCMAHKGQIPGQLWPIHWF